MNDAYKHFDPNRHSDPRISNIPDCVRRILDAGHVDYLPLHYFAEEVREEEQRAKLVIRGADVPTIRVKVVEADANYGMFQLVVVKAYPRHGTAQGSHAHQRHV